MKTKSFLAIIASAAALLASCEKPEISDGDDGGNTDPTEEAYIPGTLTPQNNATAVTLRENTEETKTLGFTYYTDKALKEDRTVTLKVDETLLKGEEKLLPEANYELAATFVVAKDTDASPVQNITFKAKGLAKGEYVLPVAEVAPEGGKASEPLFYRITVRTPSAISEYQLSEDNKVVLYVDTDIYDPRIVSNYIINKPDESWNEHLYLIGWIVNLRPAYIMNEDGRAVLSLGDKLTDVFNEFSTYVLPIQDQGSKVCLTVEGGSTGLGFCNLTEEQIDDFVAQVADMVRTYDLDGVNLWDRNSAYDQAGASGLPEVNTTSYPMLISKLREALGSDKLITVTDDGEPTSTFHDKELCGGIEVGKLIDYAWSGHYQESEGPVLVDPYHPDLEYVAKEYTNKPIAGLDPSKYGCVSYAKWSMKTADMQAIEKLFMNDIVEWRVSGKKQSDFIVFLDIITHLQGDYESSEMFMIQIPFQGFFDDGISAPGNYDGVSYQMGFELAVYYFTNPNVGEGEMRQNAYGKWLWGWNTTSQTAMQIINSGGTILIK